MRRIRKQEDYFNRPSDNHYHLHKQEQQLQQAVVLQALSTSATVFIKDMFLQMVNAHNSGYTAGIVVKYTLVNGSMTCLKEKASYTFHSEDLSTDSSQRINLMELRSSNSRMATSTKASGAAENSKAIATSTSLMKIDGFYLIIIMVNSSPFSRKAMVYHLLVRQYSSTSYYDILYSYY